MSPTMVELWKAEGIEIGEARGEARGEIRGKIKAVLGLRFDGLPVDLENRISMIEEMPTLRALEKLAFTCSTLGEFEKHLDGNKS